MSGLNERVLYIDFLRGLCCFFVVFLHVAASNWSILPPNTFEWQVFNIYDSLATFSVPIFVMLSGVSFLNPKKIVSFTDIYKKYLAKILFALMGCSAFYGIFTGFFEKQDLNYLVKSVILGHYHLWYLYMLVGLYLVTPLFRPIARDKRLAEYFILISLVFSSLLPFISHLLDSDILREILSKLKISTALGFSGYYFLGFYLNEYEIGSKTKKILYFTACAAAFTTPAVTSYISRENNRAVLDFYSYLSPLCFVYSMGIFVFFSSLLSKSSVSRLFKKIVALLARASFFIYLFHDAFIIFLKGIGLSTLSFNPVFSVPLISILVFLLSFLSFYLLKGLKKVLSIYFCKY